MIQMPVPSTNNTAIDVTIDGDSFTFLYNYNSRNSRLYLSLYKNSYPIIVGLRLIENCFPLANYPLEDFTGGQLYVFKNTESDSPVTLGNIGIDNPYWLVYIPANEWAD